MDCENEDHLKNLVQSTRTLLENIGGTELLQKELDYYQPNKLRAKFPTINHVHVRLCDSIRNTQRMRLVITDSRFELIAKQLLNCPLDLICHRGIEFITEVIRINCQLPDDAQERRRSWHIFKCGVVQAAHYPSVFGSAKQFYHYVDSNVQTMDEAWNLALELDAIKGIGPPLACDFLKEIGVDRYGKPDVHIKRTFSKLKLINNINQDRGAFEVLWQMASASNCAPAVVDKIFWMASSGRWDRTLDKELAAGPKSMARTHRKQRFNTLLDQFTREN